MSEAQWLINFGERSLKSGDTAQAKAWFLQAFEAAVSRTELGVAGRSLAGIAFAEDDLCRCRIWLLKALEAERSIGGDGVVATCIALGRLAQADERFTKALSWYECAVILGPEGDLFVEVNYRLGALYERLGDEAKAERAYRVVVGMPRVSENTPKTQARAWHQLGRLAEAQGDLLSAGEHYRRSLSLKEDQGDVASLALTRHQFGILEARRGKFASSARWATRAAKGFKACGDCRKVQLAAKIFVTARDRVEKTARPELDAGWCGAGLDEMWIA